MSEQKRDLRGSEVAALRGCHVLVLDLDVGYTSRDLELVLAMREPTSLTELTVALTELAVSTTLRASIELIPEYPFMGNTTVRQISNCIFQ